MSSKEPPRTRNDIIAAALANGATHREAGLEAGVSERTVRRRLEQPEFAQQVRNERSIMVARISNRLTGLVPRAIDTTQALLDEDVAPGVRARTATGVLSASRVWRDAFETENRLQGVESLLAARSEESER